MTTTETYTIDARNKRIGRVASEAASLLMGKNRTDFVRHQHPNIAVHIENASKLRIEERKRGQKLYTRHTGYMGGLKEETLTRRVARKGYRDILEHAIYGMLPANRLRKNMMKNLKITE